MKIVHHHIFKNAGTSIDDALKEKLASSWGSYEGAHAHDVKSSRDIELYFKENPHLIAVSTHLGRPLLPLENFFPIVFLRHPYLRAQSIYEFMRRDTSQPFSAAARGSFEDFVRWICADELGAVVARNYQVVHLSSASFHLKGILKAVALEEHFHEAIEKLDLFPFVGIVEKFSESITHLNVELKKSGFLFVLDQKHSNRTKCANNLNYSYEIPSSLYDEFMFINKLDAELHNRYSKNIIAHFN